MAMLDSPRSKSIAAMFLAVLIGYMVYSGDGISTIGVTGLQARRAQVQALRDSIASLTAQTDSVKRDLAKGSVEDLRKKTEAYRGTLETLRQLVPDKNEVPGLIDAISTRAKVRGAHLAAITPQPGENGAAQAAAARALGDTSKAMLEAKFMVKTFVKSVGAEGAPRGK